MPNTSLVLCISCIQVKFNYDLEKKNKTAFPEQLSCKFVLPRRHENMVFLMAQSTLNRILVFSLCEKKTIQIIDP